MLSSEPKWVAVYTNPRAEKRVDDLLRGQGIESYLPLKRELHNWSDRKKWVEIPLIKSYIFARITKKMVEPVRHTPGVSHIVAFKGEPATIPDSEIQMIKDFIAADAKMSIQEVQMLKRGEEVWITRGTFEGSRGRLVSDCQDGNFAVEISGISMAIVVEIDSDFMKAIPAEKKTRQREYKML